ncbi:hypothetical protein LNKW23_18430 [Paralimibaculum aggregatum]|uniref:DUF1127 domain-containing protein n=1 Tax=Paralimibaculum aggregatum TaxID=3036245 RepID=A0ABQ6LQ75_9RHOB|nr:hypothetical protein [Limibaculum sp. NKW23]GMG82630.1 hypothetical protein LNKW23_18430 [Limibaculum sp. NKW23]
MTMTISKTGVQDSAPMVRFVRYLEEVRARRAAARARRRRVEAIEARLMAMSDRNLADMGFVRADIPRIAEASIGGASGAA